MTRITKLLSLGLAAVLAVGVLAGCGGGEEAGTEGGAAATVENPLEVKIATTISGETSPALQALAKFETDVEAASEGRIDIIIFQGGQLGTESEAVDQARNGDIQMTTINPLSLSSNITQLATIEQYFLFESDEHALAFLAGDRGQELLSSFNQMGLQGVAYFPLGFRNLTNSKGPIETMDDLNGLKIRGYNPVQIAVWESVGASLSSVTWNELFTAMQQKLIDGQEGALTSFSESKFYEVQDYFTFTRHTFSTDILLANQTWLEGLHADDRAIIETALADAEAFQQQEMLDQNAALVAELTELGTNFAEVPADLLEEMRATMMPVTEASIVELAGQEEYDATMAAAEAAKQ